MTPFELVEQVKSWLRKADNIRDHPDQVLRSQGQRIWDQQSKRWNEAFDLKKLPDRTLPSQQFSPSTPDHAVLSEPSAEGTQVQGYTIQRCLEGSLYEAVNRNQEQVWLKKYQFSERDFKPEKAAQRQAAFEQLVRWNLKIGHGSDFRILKVLDVFSQERSTYLVTQPLTQALSLRQYLEAQGVMRASEVREVLRQVLETLHFLHSAYSVRLGDKFDRTLPHGNLNLNSLWIKRSGTSAIAKERRFFIYVTDLMLWEQVVKKSAISKSVSELGSVTEDLKALGFVGFQLLGGQLGEGETVSALKRDEVWQNINDRGLKSFIRRLAGLENPLPTAEAALQNLLTLPETSSPKFEEVEQEEPSQDSPASTVGCFVLLFALVGIMTMIGLILNPLLNSNQKPQQVSSPSLPEPQIPDPKPLDFPRGVRYAIERGSAWEQILNERLIDQTRKTTLLGKLKGTSRPPESRATILEAVKNEEIDIAFVVLDPPVRDLEKIAIARDTLVVFVAFSDGNYYGNVANKLLNQKDTLTREEIKQAFTSRNIRGFKAQTYPPSNYDSSVYEMFQQKVLDQTNSKQEQNEQDLEASKSESNKLYRKILDQSESDPETIAIGVDRLSRMYGQCSVYPLNVEGVQVLEKLNGTPIDLNTDLCGDKSSYKPEEFQEDYWLSYKLGIVYKKSNEDKAKKLAGIFQNQFRETLVKLGVIPIKENK